MNIGIYGDSFACIHTKYTMGKLLNSHLGLSWVEILENHGYQITNFAREGTAFMYSYKLFLQNYSKFDLNIFVVTNYTRIFVEKLDGILIFGSPSCDIEYYNIINKPDYPKKKVHLEILKSLKTYIDIYMDDEMVKHIQQSLCNNIFNICPNTILIPAFENSISSTSDGLWQASKYELFLCDEAAFKKFDFLNFDCNRKCHFSEENNYTLATEVLSAIKNNKKVVTLNKKMLKKPSKSFDFYVKQTLPTKIELLI